MSDTQWFTEQALPYSNNAIRISTKITATLYDKQSPYCHIQVFEAPFYGKLLVIDGIVQTTELDEFIYHEMMVIAPAIIHGNPKSLLIIGGGDGGAARQALRIKSLEKIVQVEIDQEVVAASEQFLPSVSQGALRDPKVELVIGDGARYVKDSRDTFDIVVLDLTDPFPGSPAEQLFDTPFLTEIKSLLSPGGIVAMQSGSLLFQTDEIRLNKEHLKAVFRGALLHTAVIPGYQLSSFAFLYGTDSQSPSLTDEELAQRYQNIMGESQYLSVDIFKTAAILPPYIQAKLSA